MKILVACFSLTGKTELIAKKLAKSLGADYVSLEPVKWKSKFAAYTVGLLLAQRRRAVEILPLEDVDVDSYDCVVVSGPVWGGAPAPVLNGFIRQYSWRESKPTACFPAAWRENPRRSFCGRSWRLRAPDAGRSLP